MTDGVRFVDECVVALRRLGRHFGCERVVLKRNRMRLYFVANPDSPFYRSPAFGQIIQFATTNVHRCRLEELETRATMLITEVQTVRQAVALLRQMEATTVPTGR